jgi:8-oxo-dGTP pyrophosphatase MutT (NUDIX family)
VTAAPDPTGDPVIRAAGGVVLRDGPDGPEVLVVHRVHRADWSLPKGHLDPGETDAAAALREVAEETGVTPALVRPLVVTEYRLPRGPKRVAWFEMRAVAGDPAARPPDREVDVARWVPVTDLEGLLSYPADLRLVRIALGDDPAR